MSLKILSTIVVVALATVACSRQSSDKRITEMTKDATPTSTKEDAQSTQEMTESAFREGMAIKDVREVRYVLETGETVPFDKFIAVVQGGRSFKKEVEGDKSLAVMTVNPKEAATASKEESVAATSALNFPVSSLLPPIHTKDLDNHLPVLANGKSYTLVSFFFADCVPCIQEIPTLNTLAKIRSDLQVVSITFEQKGIAHEFARKRGLETSIVPDSQDYIESLGVKVYPTLILVSPEGRLMGVRSSYKVTGTGESGINDLKSWINSLGVRT